MSNLEAVSPPSKFRPFLTKKRLSSTLVPLSLPGFSLWAVSSAVEYRSYTPRVTGSNPVPPIFLVLSGNSYEERRLICFLQLFKRRTRVEEKDRERKSGDVLSPHRIHFPLSWRPGCFPLSLRTVIQYLLVHPDPDHLRSLSTPGRLRLLALSKEKGPCSSEATGTGFRGYGRFVIGQKWVRGEGECAPDGI